VLNLVLAFPDGACRFGPSRFVVRLGYAAVGVVTGAWGLAIENERLHAELLAQIAELRASRARVVAESDAERRRLERNLHDGAQQRLLALSYDLRRLRATVTDDVAIGQLLESATEKTRTALAELRELAAGIYPAILTDGGLSLAVATLADTARIAVAVEEMPDERFATDVERAVYVVIFEVVEQTARSGGEYIDVRLRRSGDRLVLDLHPVAAGHYHYLVDRLGAVGGRLRVDGATLSAELPCA
jgi:signal transduction histidine kinase